MASFTRGDYRYTIIGSSAVSAKVINRYKESYQDIPNYVQGDDSKSYKVIGVSNCFEGCTSLTTAPAIPDGVLDMDYCFAGCASLTTAPTIPNDVRNMWHCFDGCTSLTTAPTIPNGVVFMSDCFRNCTSLTGNCVINSTPTDYYDVFSGTVKGIWLTGSSTKLFEIAALYENVFVDSIPAPSGVLLAERVAADGSVTPDIEGTWAHLVISNIGWADFTDNDIVAITTKDGTHTKTPTWYSDAGKTTRILPDWHPTSSSVAHAWVEIDGATHTFTVTLSDEYNTGAPISYVVPLQYRTMDFLAGGQGVAMGRPATEKGFHVDMDTTFYKSVKKQDMTTAEITVFINELRGN